ncbi:T9SS type A sorting domain-containing protein, partial [Candidatus Fermentibacteria bacterium]|nr:T9SS type A sorting domain-containing protein [Candidatus Fermentibacteria bacterium]
PLPDHYTSRHSDRNCYWLTWGGEPGSRMDTLDGSLSGAPSMPDSFLARSHHEYELYWEPWEVDSWWAWSEDEGYGPHSISYVFDAPASLGSGQLRPLITTTSHVDSTQTLRLDLNGVTVADTSWRGEEPFTPAVEVSNLQRQDNRMEVEMELTDEEYVFFDWLEVFCWQGYGLDGQLHVPLEWYGQTGRRRFDIDGDLSRSVVVYVRNDSLCSYVSTEDPSAFELELSPSGASRELWISPEDGLLRPLEITYETPGRIMASIEGAERVILAHQSLREEVLPLEDPEVETVFLTTEEVYQEFNGGVRDPQAIRAFVAYALLSWDPAPLEMVLVGSGHYDPRGFTTLEPSLIDPLFMRQDAWFPEDDFYAIAPGSSDPQLALSRISTNTQSVVRAVVDKSLLYRSDQARGNWQSRVVGAADDERKPSVPWSEVWHTRSAEEVLENHVPNRFRPVKEYLIFYPFNEFWEKPQAREHLISTWSEGALFFFYFGHGAYDQLADEGLLYLENLSELTCGARLPVAFFASCSVGEFWKPTRSCMAQEVTSVSDGGAILGCAATTGTLTTPNRNLLISWLNQLNTHPGTPVDICLLAAKLASGSMINARRYVLFGDGSLCLALPENGITCQSGDWRTGERVSFTGSSERAGPVIMRAFESALPDTYYTINHDSIIAYMDPPELFYRGQITASPDFSGDLFVSLDADTGTAARLELYLCGSDRGLLSAIHPCTLAVGSPAGTDTVGPGIEMWIDGFRGKPEPAVSDQVRVMAELSDSSGMNLLGDLGRQPALFVDGAPSNVADYFSYYPGSSTEGMLEVPLADLTAGDHTVRLRVADGLNNLSSESMDFAVLPSSEVGLSQVFVYPNPASGGASFNWTQSGDAEVEIKLYSVSGRQVRSLRNLEGVAGYNQCWWDGLDEDGDPVASGTYVFVISTRRTTQSEKIESAEGILAVIR